MDVLREKVIDMIEKEGHLMEPYNGPFEWMFSTDIVSTESRSARFAQLLSRGSPLTRIRNLLCDVEITEHLPSRSTTLCYKKKLFLRHITWGNNLYHSVEMGTDPKGIVFLTIWRPEDRLNVVTLGFRVAN